MWVLFSILAAFIWAINNIVDKFVLAKWVKQPFVPVIVLAFVGLIAGIAVCITHEVSRISNFEIFLASIAGVFSVVMTTAYFKALQHEEVSRVAPLFYLAPLFILMFATLFLGEIFTPIKYLGIFLLIGGAVLISIKDIARFRFGKAVWWMLLSAFALAINQLLAKYLLGKTDFWTVFFYMRIGAFIGMVPFICIYLPELIRTVREYGSKVLALTSVNEGLNLLGILLFTLAISTGSVTLANSLASVQQLFVLLFAMLLSMFYPSILKEKMSKSIVFLKSSAIVFMLVGTFLIT